MISITKLIDILNKPALLYWANKVGLNGESLNDYYGRTSKRGISKHKEIEEYLLNKVLFKEADLLNKCLDGYSVKHVEYNVSNTYITGRVDLILSNNNESIIVDFKSNNKVYLQQKLQLSAYKELYGANKIAIINTNKWKLEFLDIDTEKYYEMVKRLYQIHELLILLNEKL